MKIQLKGILQKVHAAEMVGKEKKTKKQTVTVFRPARTDEFGETVGNADNFELTVFNDKIAEATLQSLMSKKVDVTGFLNTYEYDEAINGTPTGQKRHALSLTLTEIKEIAPKTSNQQ